MTNSAPVARVTTARFHQDKETEKRLRDAYLEEAVNFLEHMQGTENTGDKDADDDDDDDAAERDDGIPAEVMAVARLRLVI